MHLCLKFEKEIFKIVKVMAILIVFLNARASRAPTCMHVLSCTCSQTSFGEHNTDLCYSINQNSSFISRQMDRKSVTERLLLSCPREKLFALSVMVITHLLLHTHICVKSCLPSFY